jgi:hypothetical protein
MQWRENNGVAINRKYQYGESLAAISNGAKIIINGVVMASVASAASSALKVMASISGMAKGVMASIGISSMKVGVMSAQAAADNIGAGNQRNNGAEKRMQWPAISGRLLHAISVKN